MTWHGVPSPEAFGLAIVCVSGLATLGRAYVGTVESSRDLRLSGG